MNTLWMLRGLHKDRWVYLTEHVGRTKQDLTDKVMAEARREGFNGTFSERLKQLDWAVVEVEFREKV